MRASSIDDRNMLATVLRLIPDLIALAELASITPDPWLLPN